MTGGSRYTGGGVTTGGGFSGGSDPFTGGGAYSTQPASIARVLPVRTFLTFKKINAAAAQSKVEEFIAAQPGTVDDATKASLTEAFQIVASDKPSSSETYQPHLLLALVLRWDEAYRFPCRSLKLYYCLPISD